MKNTEMPLALVVVMCASLTACGGMRAGAEAAIRGSLNDPDSARFGDFHFNEKTQKGCMTVSAKNSYGGYGEEQEAFLIHNSEGWSVDDIANVAHQGCILGFSDKID